MFTYYKFQYLENIQNNLLVVFGRVLLGDKHHFIKSGIFVSHFFLYVTFSINVMQQTV